MLNFFKKNEPLDIPFLPEIALYKIKDEEENKHLIHIRFASGDENQIHLNGRISAESIKSINLEISGFEKFQCLPSHPSIKFIEFKSAIKIERFNAPDEEFLLAEHRVAIHGQYELVKKTNGKNSKELVWISFAQAEREIKEILQEEFSAALHDYLNIDNETQPLVRSVEKSTTQKSSKAFFSFSNILNFSLIAVVTYTVIVFAYGKIKGPSVANIQTQNTVLEAVSPEEIERQASSTPNADDMVMQEFGLEPGVNLDQ